MLKMDSVDEIMQLCRLCLVKDEVNIPIFEEQGDIRQIFLKISACLPVKVSREDNLPKNICDGCSCKLEALYQFWNTSANSEKKLMKWLSQGCGTVDKAAASDKHSMNVDPVVLKQEVVEVPDDRHSTDDDLVPDDLNVSNDADDYLIQQQQLPYQNVEFQFQQDELDQTGTDVVQPSPPSRKRRAAAIRAMANMGSEDEANPDLLEPKIAKTEEESEESCNEDPEPTAFVGLPSATDNEQPGPSGVGKPAADAPDFWDEETKWSENQKPIDSSNTISTPQLLVPLYRLVIEKTSPDYYNCSKCDKRFSSKKSLSGHDRYNHAQRRIHPCKICGKLFVYQYEAKKHESVHMPKTKKCLFECNICGKSYKVKTSLQMHVEVDHYNIVRFTCKECGKNFKALTSLKAHQKKIHLGVILKCEDCGKTYRDALSFENHKKTHLPNYVRTMFTCSFCQVQFASVKGYKRHIKVHVSGPQERYVCDVCGMSITSFDSLKRHLQAHTGMKPFKCYVCEKAFSAKRFLRTHVLVHTKEKPYCCDYCQQRFSQRSSLTTHLRRHTGERPYDCSICKKSFISKTLLVSHMKTHKVCSLVSNPDSVLMGITNKL